MYGVDPALAAAGAPLNAFVDGIHPDDRAWVGERIQRAIDTAGEFAEEYRLLAPDGAVTWVYAQGRCYHNAEGRPLRYPGVATDITDAKHAGLRQDALLKLGDRLREPRYGPRTRPGRGRDHGGHTRCLASRLRLGGAGL